MKSHKGHITVSHSGSATPRYTSSPEGPARQQPGDVLRLELRTQNGSEPPQPATGRTRKVRTVLGPLQSAGPPRATPQVPSSVSSCVKWGFNGLSVVHFPHFAEWLHLLFLSLSDSQQ